MNYYEEAPVALPGLPGTSGLSESVGEPLLLPAHFLAGGASGPHPYEDDLLVDARSLVQRLRLVQGAVRHHRTSLIQPLSRSITALAAFSCRSPSAHLWWVICQYPLTYRR